MQKGSRTKHLSENEHGLGQSLDGSGGGVAWEGIALKEEARQRERTMGGTRALEFFLTSAL